MQEKASVKNSLAEKVWKTLQGMYGDDARFYLESFVFGLEGVASVTEVSLEASIVIGLICDVLSSELKRRVECIISCGVGSDRDKEVSVYYYTEVNGVKVIIAQADHKWWAVATGYTYDEYENCSKEERVQILLEELEKYIKDILEECRETLKKLNL